MFLLCPVGAIGKKVWLWRTVEIRGRGGRRPEVRSVKSERKEKTPIEKSTPTPKKWISLNLIFLYNLLLVPTIWLLCSVFILFVFVFFVFFFCFLFFFFLIFFSFLSLSLLCCAGSASNRRSSQRTLHRATIAISPVFSLERQTIAKQRKHERNERAEGKRYPSKI